MKRTTPLILLLIISCSTRETRSGSDTLSIPTFTNVDVSVKMQMSNFLTDYFALNQTLIEDNFAAAKLSAASFTRTANSFDISKLSPEQLDFYLVHSSTIKTGLEDVSKSEDIDGARAGLAGISEGLYALVKAFHPHDSPLYYQHCPMARDNKGANWLSSTKKLVNPYMGQMMLGCGRTQETIE